ncbi:pyridoxamine 5'-phosphate oxidase family protein [uncultured Parasphingorhabdus sp.]|uniref:pyridoxamine 5'-phosphate oxidase family protein n=1 Tax=uncultured Parasphingorhabdus sp. TaxID=2709694 RepID=UPI0030D9EEB0|tara:strand:+ start:60666 stop:61310 length:645 start_codon:yes stop_codon:yes gene_type:complete
MAQNYIRTLFTDAARAMQEEAGSRGAYARMEEGGDGGPDLLGKKEAMFLAARDSFYIASVTADGWPYVQHRGGPAGFLKLLDGNRLAFADYRGNKQYISTSNLQTEPRVSLFLMDYPNRRRLKILGKARIVEVAEDPALVTSLINVDDKTVVERIYLIDVIGFDWNCPQFITPRFTEAEVASAVAPLTAELEQLRAEVAQLRAGQSPLNPEQGE